MTSSTQPAKSSKLLPILVGVGLFVVAVIALASFAVYNFVLLPGQIAESINKNVDVINASFDKSKKEYNAISTKLSAKNDAAQTVTNITESIDNLNKLKMELANDRNSLSEGQNADTKRLAEAGREMLDQNNSVVKTLQNSLEHQSCLVTAAGEFASKFEASQKLLTQEVGNDNAKLAANIDQAVTQIDTGTQALTTLKACFKGDFASSLTSGLTKAIEDDSKLYLDLSAALKQLSGGVKNNSLSEVNAANAKITTLTSQESKLDKNPEFQKLVKAPEEKIKQALQELEKSYSKFEQVYKEVREKYGLELKQD
jgi:hypothetical protein